MKKNEVRAYAQANGLDVVTLTSGAYALVGFNDFAAVEAAAKALGRDWTKIIHLSKRDGELWYHDQGTAHEEYTLTADMYGMDYEMYKAEDADDYLAGEMDFANDVRDNEEDEETARAIEEAARANADKIRVLEPGHAVLMCGNEIVDTVKVRCMEFRFDSKEYKIGLKL